MRDVLTDVLDLVGVLALVVGVALGCGALVATLTSSTPLGLAAGLALGGGLLLALSWLVDRQAHRDRRGAQ